MISYKEAAELLLTKDNIGILIHAYPDGDAVGSSYALCSALRANGKRARVICHDEIPDNFSYIKDELSMEEFEPETYVTTDVASMMLLGDDWEKYNGKIFMSIDHHSKNSMQPQYLLVEGNAASACEIVYKIILEMDVEITRLIAECIYTGLATDTGCFRYSNTTSECHITAAQMLEKGIRMDDINRVMFETRTRERLEMEKLALESIEYYANGKVALMSVTNEMKQKSGAKDEDLEGITSIPRQIEGVMLGITVREKENGDYKISLRSYEPVNAAEICAEFGGGGHMRAAGCTLVGELEEVKKQLVDVALKYVK